jgi:LRP1 type putative zinc finger protein
MDCPECGNEMKDDGVDYYFCPVCCYERAYACFLLTRYHKNRKL